MDRFAGKGVLITGGSSGIGLATARRLAAEGARVVINGRDPQRVSDALSALITPASISDQFYGIVADISVDEEVQRLVEGARTWLGHLDVLVNSAGIDGAGVDALDLTPMGFRRVLEVNLTGPFLVAQAVATQMVIQGGGAIVNVASLNGLAAEPHFADYNTAKGGLLMLTRSLAVDLVDRHIRVNAVLPGYILTPMTAGYAADPDVATPIRAAIPMARFGDPSEVAAAIAFLASDDASYITGELLVVDGGRYARQ